MVKDFVAPTGYDSETRMPSFFETIRSEGRTQFQMSRLMEIASSQDFAHFCGNPGCDEYYRGPFVCLWYTKNCVLHAERIGQQKVIRSTT